MRNSTTTRATWIRVASALAMAAAVGGCGTSSLLPLSAEPDRRELSAWQHERLLQAPRAVVPAALTQELSPEDISAIALFLTRTLETAPDGETRTWQNRDRTVRLAVRPVSTAATGETVCRQAVLNIGIEGPAEDYGFQACRRSNGVWVQ